MAPTAGPGLRVEVWSDVVCPWCYVGKRRLEAALEQFDHAEQVEVVWRSFELDAAAPRRREAAYVDHLAAKYGVGRDEAQAMIDRIVDVGDTVGIEFRFDRAQAGNTFDAHRLLHLARAQGQEAQGVMKERLMRAYFTEGLAVGDADVLVRLAAEVGVADAAAVLADPDAFADDVRTDEAEAAALGARGVPFFVVDRRYGVSGAQATDLFIEVLERAWSDRAA